MRNSPLPTCRSGLILIDTFEPNTEIEQSSIISTLIATISVYRLARARGGGKG